MMLQNRIKSPSKVKITARSSLVLAGDITIGELDVDGALEIIAHTGACVHIKRLIVRNAGWMLVCSYLSGGVQSYCCFGSEIG
jgi:hypothetical protein